MVQLDVSPERIHGGVLDVTVRKYYSQQQQGEHRGNGPVDGRARNVKCLM